MKPKVHGPATSHGTPDSRSQHPAGPRRPRTSVWGCPVPGLRNSLVGAGLLSSALWLLTACNLPLPRAQSDQTRYFLLTPAGIRPAAGAVAPARRWVVGIRRVDVAAYLQTKSFAIRSHANEVAFLDFARWGEPLEQGIARVLAEDLQAAGNVARVSRQSFRADDLRDFDVAVDIAACEGTADGDVRFAATWRITSPGRLGATVAEGSYTAAGLRWDDHDYGQLAARLSEALAGLSRDIAAALPKEPAG